jgi:hypothetical protein
MKKLPFIFPLFFLILSNLVAQDAKYQQVMSENLQAFAQAKTVEEMQNVANKFARISTLKAQEWLPNYWLSYTYVRMSLNDTDKTKKDQYLDEAEKAWKTAQKFLPQADEMTILAAYIANARMAIDPMSRWQTFGSEFREKLAEAKALNPENPRIYFLEGQSAMYTPEQFGGGKANAKKILLVAAEKFAKFKPASEFHPNWGEARAQALLKECEQ